VTAAGEPRPHWSAVTAFVLCAVALWLVLYPYFGIAHDGILYTMQGLAHARPDLYGNDLYIRYGSQDRFTLFGSLYALVMQAFGIEHAAAILTLLFQGTLILAAWQLARQVMPREQALLAAFLLLAINPPYGSGAIFHVFEYFVSPRPLAQTLVLLGTTALISRRETLALSLYVLAALFHPIMACAGFGMWLWLRVVAIYPRRAALCVLASICALTIAARFLPVSHDAVWLKDLREWAPYLELSNSSVWDWNRLGLSATTLIVGALIYPQQPLRALVIGALAVTVGGVLATAIVSDWLHLRYLTQGQFWRCAWLGYTVSTLSLPWLATCLWRGGSMGRTALALIASAYCLQDSLSCLPIAAMALVAAAFTNSADRYLTARVQRMLLAGGLTLLLVGAIWNSSNGLLSTQHPLEQFAGPAFASRFRALANGCLIAPLLLSAVWWFGVFRGAAVTRALACVAGLLGCAAVLPSSVAAWTHVTDSPALVGAFDRWRNRIEVGTEVLFVGSPLRAWILLQRPSYITADQRASGIFSREAAMMIVARLQQYDAVDGLDAGGDLKLLSSLTLAQACARSSVRFLVTHQLMDKPPVETLSDVRPPYAGLKLYQCPSQSG
jgi:hypothetical protein